MSSPSPKSTHPSSGVDPDVLIKVNNVSKKFCRDFKKSLWYGLKDTAGDILHPKHTAHDSALRPGEFWANQNISFEVKRGECLGLIGHNGAGKTTLLKMLNGLIKPDAGSIEMRGRIGALIALGAGFNPILTGRENIYINGSILGFSKDEIDEKINDIIEFAEIEDAIDAPVRTYSSGMQVRLGFSIASSMRPDILILDEVLAVGDIGFVVKCLNRVRELSQNCAVVFVSHQMQFISSFCTRVIVMDQGMEILDAANAADGINCYYDQMEFKGSESGAGGVKLTSLKIQTNRIVLDESNPVIPQGEECDVEVCFSIDAHLRSARLLLFIDDESQSQVINYLVLDDLNIPISFGPGTHRVKIPLGVIDLNAGSYSFMVALNDTETKINLLRKSGVTPFQVKADIMSWSKIVRPIKATVC
jgi:lipopolysaccharide transport system ATP-binding protein